METEIAVGTLRIDPKLPARPEYRGIRDLATDIEQRGLLSPLVVRPSRRSGMFDIVCGRRRWLALQELGWQTARCSVREDLAGDDEAASLASLAETLLRQEPGKLEMAWNLARLKKASGSATKHLARLTRLSAATVRRYCAVGSTVTPEALAEAGIEFDEAVRMPIRALDLIARTEDDAERMQKLRAAADARRGRRSVLHAVAPELDTSSHPYQVRRTRAGGLSLTVRRPADQWPAEVADRFVREFTDHALPVVRTAWEQAGTVWPGDAPAAPDGAVSPQLLQAAQRQAHEEGRQEGITATRAAAKEVIRREVQKVRDELDAAHGRLHQMESAAPAETLRIEHEVRLRLEQSENDHRKELSSLKLRYELAMAQQRQQAQAEREELIRAVVELQRETGTAAQQRQAQEAELATLRAELARVRRGGIKGLIFGG
jgi:ParB/RepB/Spo0J family partition protein